jgi:drug/metabolite transporter (DMT)-like permease
MLTFLALCLLSRIAYTFNDVLVGELARTHDGVEIATFRGLGLGLTMAPLLFWVAPGAWAALAARPGEVAFLVAVTSIGNVLHLEAARHLPFGLRAALLVAGVAVGGISLGTLFFEERFSFVELGWCTLVVVSGVLAAMGDHSTEKLSANVPKGAILTLTTSALLSVAAFSFARLARATDPMLVGWVWEFGIGLLLVVPLLWRKRGHLAPGVARRFLRTALCSLPTVVGTGATAVALTLGPLGVWSALAGTQALLSAALGAAWHREKLGPRRWSYFVLGALAIGGLAFAQRTE